MRSGSPTQAYSSVVRLFCFTVNFYSPKAYEYIREYFNRNIPGIRTLRSWYSSINGSPGFTDCAFDALKQKVNDARTDGKELICGLIFDEMSVRTLCQWDAAKKQFLGNITNGKEGQYDICSPLAKNALIFMISGVNVQFKIPIGYFFVNYLSGAAKAAIIMEAMYRLNQIGVKLCSVTYDGAPANIKAVKILGVCFDEKKTFFINPYDRSKVYVFLDPPHMLKLARNILGHSEELTDQEGGKISWSLIKNLVELQTSENVDLGNKLTKNHTQFKNVIMNVKIAAQTLSNSTADSLEYLDTHVNHEKFQNSKPTVNYIRVFNNLFDIMNSKEGHCKDQYKRPFSEESVNDFETYFEFAEIYIRGLRLEQKGIEMPILDSESFTGYFGFLHNMSSFMGIYKDYIKKNGIDKFYTFGVSQDHVESYFGCIRRMHGCNDNPSQQQFTAAYRKLLFHNEVSTSWKSNCENDVTKILSVPFNRSGGNNAVNSGDLEHLANYDFEHPDDANLHDIEDDIRVNDSSKRLLSNTRAYSASIVEKNVINKIARKGKKKCMKCINVFSENELTDDQLIAFKSQSSEHFIVPCKSTLTIINFIENFLNKYQSEQVSYNASVHHILKNIDMSDLYESSDFNSEEHDHKAELIELVIKEYLDRKSMHVGRIITKLTQEKKIRHANLKLTHNLGQ